MNAKTVNGISIQILLAIAITIMAAGALFLVFSSGDAEARVLVVDNQGGGNFTNIGTALLSSEEGDTIIVREGNYSLEPFSYALKDNLTLQGAGREKTCLVATPITSVVISNSSLTITGFNISQGKPDPSHPGEINIFDCSNLTLSNNTFYNFSGGVKIRSGTRDLTITNNQFINTIFFMDVDTENASTIRLENDTIDGRPLHYFIDKSNLNFTKMDGGYILVNCTNIAFENMKNGTRHSGIQIDSSSRVTLRNCSADASPHFFYLGDSNNVSMENYTVNDGYWFYLLFSENISIKNCNITGNQGIYIFNVSHFQLLNSTVSIGLSIMKGEDFVVEGNRFINDSYIYVFTLTNFVLKNNALTKNGLQFFGLYYRTPSEPYYPLEIENMSTYQISGNTVAGKPIYFLYNATGVNVSGDAGQVIMVRSKNCVISGVNMGKEDSNIILSGSTNITVRDSKFNANGVLIAGGKGNLIENCTFQNTSSRFDLNHANIRITASEGNIIRGCTFLNSSLNFKNGENRIENCTFRWNGIYAVNGLILSGNTVITNTTIMGYSSGILLSGNLTMRNCVLKENANGISATGSEMNGMSSSYYLSITGCIFEDNGVGLSIIQDGTQVSLTNTIISKSTNTGLMVAGNNIQVLGGRFRENKVGVGLHNGVSGLSIQGTKFVENDAAIYTEYASSLNVSGCEITGGKRGIILDQGSNFEFTNIEVKDVKERGIGIYNLSTGTIKDSIISGCKNGIYIIYAQADIQGCNISDNEIGIYAERPDNTVTVEKCTFNGNRGAGIMTLRNNAKLVDARYNYWGSSTGPNNPENPDGKGDRFEGNVLFSPWYTDSSMARTASISTEKEANAVAVYSFIFVIIALFALLFFVVTLPDAKFRKKD